MDTICFLQVPDNFEELYGKYREKLLEDKSEKTASRGAEESLTPARARSSTADEGVEVKGDGSDTVIFKVPPGTAWRELTVKFKDEQTIEAWKGIKYLGVADFKRMGFGDKRPDQRWRFLYLLATTYATNPNKDPNDMPATINDIARSILNGMDAAKRQQILTLKTKLSSQLRKSFGLDDEPFEDYEQWHYYKTKFELKPEPAMRQEEPYEASRQLHEGVERVGSEDPNFEKLGKRRLSDEDDANEDSGDGFLDDENTSSSETL
jgi:hypothetical protein